jgi:MoaA/NifB/PqqE/SkfB family radical SAM enzyme
MTSVLDPRPRSSGDAGPSDPPPEPGCESPGTRVDDARHRLSHLPILILYPHSRCNCRCLMCDIWRATTRDEIDPAAVAAEARRWRALGVRRVVLSGGEPLMHRDLWALVRPLAEAGIGITLLSTGLLLARHAAPIARFVDDVVLSLDGPREVHDAIRQIPRAFDRLAEGVAAVRAAEHTDVPQSISPFITLSARCTVQRANCDQLRATVRAARALGLDRISFLAVDVSTEAFNRPGGWPAERREAVAPGLEDLPRLREELDRLFREHAADFASGFIAESPAKLDGRLYDYFAALAGQGDFPPVTCNAPWVSAVVEADGTVRPCFFHRAIGRWEGGSLEAVLNGPDALAFRSGLDVAADPLCRRCVCSLNLA